MGLEGGSRRRTFVCTIGFDSRVVMRLVARYGLKPDDRIVLIRSVKPHEKSDEAVKEVREFVDKSAKGVEVTEIRVDEREFIDNVVSFAKLIRDSENPVVDVSGGPRALVLALYVAASVTGIKNVDVLLEPSGKVTQIPSLGLDFSNLTERQKEVLKHLPSKTGRLARKLNVDKSAASRHLNTLSRKGLVRREGSLYGLTSLGMLVKRLIEEGVI